MKIAIDTETRREVEPDAPLAAPLPEQFLAAIDEMRTRGRRMGLDDLIVAILSGEMDNGCGCDFCTRKKLHEDNWCPQCAEVKMPPPKWWENLDVCDECERKNAERRERSASGAPDSDCEP